MSATESKTVVDLDKALGLTRDGAGIVSAVPRFRFFKIRFPKQKVFLPVLKVDVEFRLPRQHDLSQGPPIGVFDTDDEAVAKELAEVIIANSDLCIVRAKE